MCVRVEVKVHTALCAAAAAAAAAALPCGCSWCLRCAVAVAAAVPAPRQLNRQRPHLHLLPPLRPVVNCSRRRVVMWQPLLLLLLLLLWPSPCSAAVGAAASCARSRPLPAGFVCTSGSVTCAALTGSAGGAVRDSATTSSGGTRTRMCRGVGRRRCNRSSCVAAHGVFFARVFVRLLCCEERALCAHGGEALLLLLPHAEAPAPRALDDDGSSDVCTDAIEATRLCTLERFLGHAPVCKQG